MTTWLPPILAAASIALTYVFCVRPHLRGRGGEMPGRAVPAARPDLRLADLAEELRILRAADAFVTGGHPPTTKPSKPADE